MLISVQRLINEAMVHYDPNEFFVAFGKRIKQLRKERKVTMRSFVVDHGFHLTQLGRIERGDGISVPTILRLAEIFQEPLESLLAGLGSITPPEVRPKRLTAKKAQPSKTS